MKELIERVAKAIGSAPLDLCDDTPEFSAEARAAILAVLDWFSEPGNWSSDKVMHAFNWEGTRTGSTVGSVLAAAMKSAREEMSK